MNTIIKYIVAFGFGCLSFELVSKLTNIYTIKGYFCWLGVFYFLICNMYILEHLEAIHKKYDK